MTYVDEVRFSDLQTIRVDKLTNGTVIVELRSPVTISDLNALSRRDLVVTVEARQSNFKLQGVVVPRAYCELYQTLVLSNGHQADSKKDRCVIAAERAPGFVHVPGVGRRTPRDP